MSDVKVCRTTESRYTISAYRSMYFDFIACACVTLNVKRDKEL